ncbi:MAG: YigZ family protein [Anaerovoracaceae bacterium]
MILYSTVKEEKSIEQIIEKSRFIAHIKPVETRGEAESYIKNIREEHKGATHNVPAMVIGDKMQIQWASDDGEPQGTSGAPIVQMLVKENVTNVVVVVTRYFGGVKLGTGGLVRAYTGCVKEALKEAGICQVKEIKRIKYKLDYSYLAKLQSMEDGSFYKIGPIIYEDVVTIEFIVDVEEAEKLKTLVVNMTGGKGQLVWEMDSVEKV